MHEYPMSLIKFWVFGIFPEITELAMNCRQVTHVFLRNSRLL